MYLYYSTWKIVVRTCFNYIYQFLRVAITMYNKLGGLHHKIFSILNFLKNCYNVSTVAVQLIPVSVKFSIQQREETLALLGLS